MSRIYRVPFQGTLTNAGGDSDLLEIVPADDKPCRLVGYVISQISEVGDAQEEGLRISILHMGATFSSGSGGSAVTPVKNDVDVDVAAGFTAECNNTTVATTSGTTTTLEEVGWNVRNTPWERWFPDDDSAPTVRGTSGLLVRSQTTPADDISIDVTFYVKEL